MLALGLFFDWDGVVVRSETPKAAGWVLAALSLRGLAERELLDRLKTASQSKAAAHEVIAMLTTKHPNLLMQVCAMAGQSRPATCKGVAKLILGDDSPSTQAELDRERNSLRSPLLLYQSEPISGTLELLRALHGRVPLGLVTQAASPDVEKQAAALSIPLDLFGAVECVGDPFYESMAESVDRKTVAYAVACARVRCKPSNSIAFEDSDSGLESAKAAGLECIGLRESTNHQQLTLAGLVVPDLGALAKPEIAGLFLGATAAELMPVLRRLCGREG